MNAEREYFYIETEDGFFCFNDGEIGWSRHIIDAQDFSSEEEAKSTMMERDVFFYAISHRSGPPQPFLYNNPYLPSKEDRIRKNSESHDDYARRLGLLYP